MGDIVISGTVYKPIEHSSLTNPRTRFYGYLPFAISLVTQFVTSVFHTLFGCPQEVVRTSAFRVNYSRDRFDVVRYCTVCGQRISMSVQGNDNMEELFPEQYQEITDREASQEEPGTSQ